jgi:hypothetical protein
MVNGQLQMYVNYYDRIEKLSHENPTIGILLCANKNDTVVRFTLPEDKKQIIASQYELYLPTEKQLLEEVNKELENFEEKEEPRFKEGSYFTYKINSDFCKNLLNKDYWWIELGYDVSSIEEYEKELEESKALYNKMKSMWG